MQAEAYGGGICRVKRNLRTLFPFVCIGPVQTKGRELTHDNKTDKKQCGEPPGFSFLQERESDRKWLLYFLIGRFPTFTL